MQNEQIPLLVICGPTASGKTGWALQLAEQIPLEIISADSRQVYRLMDIGTAKATTEEQTRVPHHLIDLIDPDEEFSVADFVELARPLIAEIHKRGRLPCVVGGTGLYIRALLGGLAPLPTADPQLRAELHRREEQQGSGTLHRELQQLDPQAAAAIHPHNIVRVVRALEVYRLSGRRMSEFQAEHSFADQPYRVLQYALRHERSELFERINQRAAQMLAEGLVDEVKMLVTLYSPELKALQTLGYREVLEGLQGMIDFSEVLERIAARTRQYAKRQLTWFRKEQQIIWVDSSNESGRVLQSIDKFLLGKRSGYA